MRNVPWPKMSKSLRWSPTVAMSWLWGLGFFYSIHVTLAHGLLAFALFALPNALGLFLFGHVLERQGDPEGLFREASGRYAPFMIAYQVAAVAVTLFGVGAYFLVPLLGPDAAIGGMAILALVSCVVGHMASIRTLCIVHAGYVIVGVAAALLAAFVLSAGPTVVPVAAPAGIDSRFFGLMLPSLVGFLLGPWLDVQQWQRVVEIRRAGGNASRAYAGGAAIFLLLLCVNAGLALAAGFVKGHVADDGLLDAEPAVTYAALASGGIALAAFGAWAMLAMSSTLDSFYAAARWFLGEAARRSVNPLLAFVPPGLAASPLPWLALALAVAAWGISSDLSLMHLMAPFATLLVGAAACLACEALGGRPRLDKSLCLMTGTLSAAAFLAGYTLPSPTLLWLSSLIALVPVAGPVLDLRNGKRLVAEPTKAAVEEVVPDVRALRVAAANAPAESAAPSSGHYAGSWFVYGLTPTYDDTNSVGNIYFANYVRWVGKARELFFADCMPDFDLKDTRYYILTKSITHDFKRETAEFDAVEVRIRIRSYNRKFVVLEHEIHSEKVGLLGKGQQDLMFVDSATYGLVDIPGDILKGFLPHFEDVKRRAAA